MSTDGRHIDTHDTAGMIGWLRERAKANREVANLPREQWPYHPDVQRHFALRLDQVADELERQQQRNTRLEMRVAALAELHYGKPTDCPKCDGIDPACGEPCKSAGDVEAAPDGWCPICGGQNGEHKPGCEDGSQVL